MRGLIEFQRTKQLLKNLAESEDAQILYRGGSNTAIDQIKSVLAKKLNQLDSDVILGNSNDSEEQKKWIIAIYEYQEKISLGDGIISPNGTTIRNLTVDLLFPSTQQALQKLIREVSTTTNKSESEIKIQLKKLLNNKPQNLSLAIDANNTTNSRNIAEIKKQQFILMEAIKQFEEENNVFIQTIPDRLIIEGDQTYQYLKSELSSE